jgi:hypothetical protein
MVELKQVDASRTPAPNDLRAIQVVGEFNGTNGDDAL